MLLCYIDLSACYAVYVCPHTMLYMCVGIRVAAAAAAAAVPHTTVLLYTILIYYFVSVRYSAKALFAGVLLRLCV